MIDKLSDKHLGATVALTNLLRLLRAADRSGEWEFVGLCLDLDRIGLYGEAIYILHADLCGGRPDVFQQVLRRTREMSHQSNKFDRLVFKAVDDVQTGGNTRTIGADILKQLAVIK